MDFRTSKRQKEPFFVFAGHQLVEIRSTGLVCSGYGGRFQLYCRTCGSVQRIRQNSIESVCRDNIIFIILLMGETVYVNIYALKI